MALLVCTGCTAAYSVGARCCPQCGSKDYVEEGQQGMPKITVHGGPSNAHDETADAESAVDERGEGSSPGSSSSTSSARAETSPEPSESKDPLPVRTTGSRSKRARTGGSTARGTDGDPTEATSATDE